MLLKVPPFKSLHSLLLSKTSKKSTASFNNNPSLKQTLAEFYAVVMNKKRHPKTDLSSDDGADSTAGIDLHPAGKDTSSMNPSALSRFWAAVFNRNPEDQKRAENQKTKLFATAQQLAAVKAHLMPLTLFVKVNKLLAGLVFISAAFLIITIVEHLSLYPLVETQYNYAEFVGSDHNFVNVVHTRHIDNEALIESLLRRYVVEREQIIKKPSRLIEKFSSPEVYKQYFHVIKTIAEKDLRSQVRRFIKILRYQKIESNIRQLEVEFTDMIKTQNTKDSQSMRISKSTWLINIRFDFIDTIRKYNEVAINPAGLIVTVYSIKRQS